MFASTLLLLGNSGGDRFINGMVLSPSRSSSTSNFIFLLVSISGSQSFSISRLIDCCTGSKDLGFKKWGGGVREGEESLLSSDWLKWL